MTDDISPAAQAVWDAYQHVDCDAYLVDPRMAGLAAGLRAAADQVVPAELAEYQSFTNEAIRANRMGVRAELIAIADELVAQQ